MYLQHMRRSPAVLKVTQTIYFYEKTRDYYYLTNYAPYEVVYNGRRYPTSEHLFHALKFLPHRPQLGEHIRVAGDRPAIPGMEARRFVPEFRPDCQSVNPEIMEEVLEAKFTQHPKFMKELLATGDAKLVFDSRDKDAFWGNGADGKGLNHLGYALMSIRDRYRAPQSKLRRAGAPV